MFSQATKKHATTIKLDLLENEGDISVEYESDQACEETPPLPDFMWSCLATSIPKFASIEVCQRVLIDPTTEDTWRFSFTKETDTMLLSKLESQEAETV